MCLPRGDTRAPGRPSLREKGSQPPLRGGPEEVPRPCGAAAAPPAGWKACHCPAQPGFPADPDYPPWARATPARAEGGRENGAQGTHGDPALFLFLLWNGNSNLSLRPSLKDPYDVIIIAFQFKSRARWALVLLGFAWGIVPCVLFTLHHAVSVLGTQQGAHCHIGLLWHTSYFQKLCLVAKRKSSVKCLLWPVICLLVSLLKRGSLRSGQYKVLSTAQFSSGSRV